MRTYFTLFLLVLLGLFSNLATARTIYVAAPANVNDSVTSAADGDIIELTTSGGAYTWSKSLTITTEKSLTIRASQGLAARPVISWTGSSSISSSNYFIRYSPTTTLSNKTLTVQGLDFNGKNFCYYFLYATPASATGLSEIIDNSVIRNIYYKAFYYYNSYSSSTLGDLTVTNSEFRNCGYVVYASGSYYCPTNMTFTNCLFLAGINSSSFLQISTSSYNSLKVDHCTFLKSQYSDMNVYGGTGTFSIKNSIFAYNSGSSSSSFGNSYVFGSDCGFYTTTGYTNYNYYNIQSALTTDPLIQTTDSATFTGYATASAYQTGSTDGKPIGYYRTTYISSSVSSIGGLDYIKTSGPSPEQSFKVNGLGLTEDVTITPPVNFEVSKTSGSSFGSSAITVAQTSGAITATNIYVRLKAGLTDSTYTGVLKLTSKNAATVIIPLTGTAINKATILLSTKTLSGFKYVISNGPSTEQAFVVSGVNLNSNLTITAPTNYEISPLSGSAFIAMSSIPIAQSGGTVNPTTIYVRLKSGLSINTYSQNLTLTATGAVTKSITLSGSVTNPPAITLSKTSISKLCFFYPTYSSTVDSLVISATDLNAGITITPSSYFQVSTSRNSGFVGSSSLLTLPLTGSGVPATTIYVRIDPTNYYTGTLTGSLTVVSTSVTSKTVSLSGYGYYNMPSTTVSNTTLSGYKYFAGSGPSAEQSFTVGGSYLADNITITAPTNYEISTTTGSSFSGKSSISLVPTYQSISTTTIYVRMKAGLSSGNYNESVVITSPYTTTVNIAVSGSVSNIPTIIPSATSITGMDYKINNGPSVEKSFTVSGIDLASLILVSAPTNFEISSTTGTDFSATSQLIITQSGGIASTTTIYVRLKSGLAVNTYSGNISLISSNATIQNISCNGTVKLLDAVDNPQMSDVKVYPSNSNIVIDGTKMGENVSVYNISGMLLYSNKSLGDKISIPVGQKAMYIVKIGDQTVKVIL
jgi:hypothetical protein